MNLNNARCVCNPNHHGSQPCPVCGGRKEEKPKTIRRIPSTFGGPQIMARVARIKASFGGGQYRNWREEF